MPDGVTGEVLPGNIFDVLDQIFTTPCAAGGKTASQKMPCYPVQVQVKLSLKTASSLWVDALSEEVDAPSQPADTAPISLAQVLALLKRK